MDIKVNSKTNLSTVKKNTRKTNSAPGTQALKITGAVFAIVWLAIAFLLILVPINLRAVSFWLTLMLAVFLVIFFMWLGDCNVPQGERPVIQKSTSIGTAALSILVLVFLVLLISGTKIFHAAKYAAILPVTDSEFTEDLPEAAGTDSIALMDTKSAKKLGDREIGSLANVVSQYNVAEEYTQIDFQGKPKKVADLEYAGFFKWINNKNSGVPGYVIVDPVSMSGSYKALKDNMIYVPSAYLGQDAARHMYLSYPTVMFENLHFEIDEEGNPYFVASVFEKTISLFGGAKVTGALIMNPVTGEVAKYDIADVPRWCDVVVDGNTICERFNWYGTLSNGFMNSLFGKKGCKQVTEYRTEENEDEDEIPVSDYGYVAKDGDIWIYTGVTSVNSDSSNIGFLMANERTGEARFYNVSGADEKSAMSAAEGEVQEKRYQASFPSLINVDGYPTYIMVLKDSSGLVKLYATVNVEQYNLVTTATSQKDCIAKYRKMMGIADVTDPESGKPAQDEEPLEAEAEKTITIKDIKYIDIDGNTFIYLVTTEGELYRAKAASHEEMLLLEAGQTVTIGYAGKNIVTVE